MGLLGHRFSSRRFAAFICYWLLGLILGTLFAVGADASLFSLMRAAASCRVSIVLLLLTAVLPFLIAAYAVFVYRYAILNGLVLLKAFAYSFCGVIAIRAFGSAGWLVQPMLQFTDTVSSVAFCSFVLRCCLDGSDIKRHLVICIMICAIAAIIDYTLVSQFLMSLL